MKNIPNLRFKEFSDEWENKKMGEITIKVGSGKTPKGGNSVYTDEGVIFLRSQNVLNGKLSLNDVAYITDDINSTMKSTEVYPNDILLNITGASIGRSCCVPEDFGKANVNQHVCIIRLNEKYNPNFIMNQIISSKIQKQIDSFQAGGNREGLNFEQIKGMKIGSTSIEEQEKIASFFSLMDKKIELQIEKVEELKNYKKGIMQKIFPKNGETIPELRFAGFTNDWEECKLEKVTKLITKGTTPKDKSWIGPVNYIKTESIDKDSGSLTRTASTSLEEHEGYLKRSQLQNNDVLFSIVGTLGRVGLVGLKDLPANTNQQIAIIRTDELNPYFLMNILKSPKVKSFIESDSTVGAQPSLSLWQINELKICIPSIAEQQKIGHYFLNLDKLITLHQRKLDALNEYKKGLLQQMFI